jgi:hypothetical protein
MSVDSLISHGSAELVARRMVRRLEQSGEHAARYLTYSISSCSSIMVRLSLCPGSLAGRAKQRNSHAADVSEQEVITIHIGNTAVSLWALVVTKVSLPL